MNTTQDSTTQKEIEQEQNIKPFNDCKGIKKMRKFKTINYFKVGKKVVISQRTTKDRELAMDRFEQGFKAKLINIGVDGKPLITRTRGFKRLPRIF